MEKFGRRATLGKKRFKCGECQAVFFASRKEMSRAARLKCPGCGSARVEISEAGAKALATAQAVKQTSGPLPCPGAKPCPAN